MAAPRMVKGSLTLLTQLSVSILLDEGRVDRSLMSIREEGSIHPPFLVTKLFWKYRLWLRVA